MSALGSANFQNSATESLAWQSGQPTTPNVLPPFSGNLSVDEGLKLSNENFKQLIENSLNKNKTLLSQLQRNPVFPTPNLLAHVASKSNLASNYFFKGKVVSPISQLRATPPFPTPNLLAQFAYKAYEDYYVGETDAQYETRLALLDGWKLLTTASNSSKGNGYFGAAYWHPERQQVVIAHRGTDPTNLGALRADVKGVLLNQYVWQMESASTFAHKVLEVLGGVNREYRVCFQLFFTGHSLGGWLAQVTTFTTEHLKTESKFFLRRIEDNDYHPHTVVFDSPGCKEMLLQMTDKLDVRLDGRSIDIEHLDITSYLSAPNRINTCNAHLGTVYRIFPDFSDMGWLGKHTACYNLKAHSMQKIVNFFQTREGQIHKDEKEKLKILEVIDWPICAGFRRGEEYKRFFKEAKHLNDYHLEVRDVTFQIEGYHPMRYQTKAYDERVSRLGVFCQQERQFLESYRWLRQLPEFFKPEDLFSEIENDEVQEKAVNILKGFEIENDKICCTDGSELQALIPYVKRLLQLFPEIKENTSRALSSYEIRNRVYQIETKGYIERVNQSPLEFKSDASRFTEFLESFRVFLGNEKQKILQLQMVDGNEWIGLMKVYQVIKKIGCLSEGQYTVLKLKRLLKVNQFMDLSKAMQSKLTPHILLMACEENQLLDEERKDVIRSLFDTIKQKRNIKIVFITRPGGSTVTFLHHMIRRISGEGFVRDELLTWSDLTTSSQEKLLEESVKFQGAIISLKELMSVESPVAQFLPLCALLEEKELKIADPVPIANAYDEDYYIGRTLRQRVAIKQDIFIGQDVIRPDFYLAGHEREYKKLCQLHPNSNVHWVQKEKSGYLVLQQSQGSLETLREYIDTEGSQTYTSDDLDKLLEQAQHKRVMLISDTAGMGKSTVLTHLSKQIKQKFPAKWVVRIDLNDHTDVLNALKQEQIDMEKAIEFVSKKLLKLKTGLEMELFKECCRPKQKVRLVIMLDGFDEISPLYEETIIDLLQVLRQTAVEQLWVTTRPHLREELEGKLQQLSYTLEPFSEENQIEFLDKFWSLSDWFTKPENKDEEVEKNKLQIYAKHLIKKLAKSISDYDSQFTGIPLQTRMLAEAFEEEVKIFFQSAGSTPMSPFKLDLLVLYKRFIERKYDIYQEEKLQVPVNSVSAKEQRKRELREMRKHHQLLALQVLFNEEQVTLFQNNTETFFSTEELTRIGIVQVSHDGKPHFIHRTFAEYYVADYLVNRLTEGNNISEQVQAFILRVIFQKEQYKVIRVFVDGLLSRTKPPKEVLKEYADWINGPKSYAEETLNRAAMEGNANIVEFLLDIAKATGFEEAINQLLLGKGKWRRGGAWDQAAGMGNIKVLQKLWKWAEEELTTDGIRNEILFRTDSYGRTILHMAEEWSKLDIMQDMWDWAQENLTREELKYELLIHTDYKGRTFWLKAVQWGKQNLIQKIWEWAEKKLTTDELKGVMLLRTDFEGLTVWVRAVYCCNQNVLQKIWEWAEGNLKPDEIKKEMVLRMDNKGRTIWYLVRNWDELRIMYKMWKWAQENLTTEEIKIVMLLRTHDEGRTVWLDAVYRGNQYVLQKIWEWAEKKLTTDELKAEMLLRTDREGLTVWIRAICWSNQNVLQKIWDWAEGNLKTDEIKKEMVLRMDNKGRTIWYLVRNWDKLQIMHKMWEWTQEHLTTEEIKIVMLLRTHDEGRTVWLDAVYRGNQYVLQKIWEWAEEKLTTEEIKNEILLRIFNEGRTVWHVAAYKGNQDVLQKIWEWAEEKLTTEEIKNETLLRIDNEGRTVWHVAAYKGNQDLLKKIWEWAEGNLTTEEIKNEILLCIDNEGRTVWHVAAYKGKVDVIKKIWEWAEGKLTREELKYEILLRTDNKGRTAWHEAAYEVELEVMQKIWE